MSNATAARIAETVARLIAAPFNAPIDIAEATATDVIEFARTSKTSPAKVSAKTIERLIAATTERFAVTAEALANVEADHVVDVDFTDLEDDAERPHVKPTWHAFMGNNYGETWDGVYCYGDTADEAAADAVVKTATLNGGGWTVHRVELKGVHHPHTRTLTPVREVEADDAPVAIVADDVCGPSIKPAVKAPQDDAKRTNFKHDACTHERTPKARAACRKARANV